MTYSEKFGAAKAILQAAVGMGMNTGTTFGAARTTGEQAVVDAVGDNIGEIRKLLTEHTHSADSMAKARAAQIVPGTVAGGGLAAAGSILGQVLFAPAVVAVLEQIMGGKSTLVPVNPEHLVPDEPGNMDDVNRRRDLIRERQGKFDINTTRGIVTGSTAFSLANAARATVLDTQDPDPSLGTRIWSGVVASGLAGAATGGGLALQKAMATERVTIGGAEHDLPLFTVDQKAATNVFTGVANAMKAFNGDREALFQQAQHLGSQLALRGLGVVASTVVNAGTQVGASAAKSQIDDKNRLGRGGVDAAFAVVAFTAAVAVWFTLLPKIQARQKLPAPDQAGA